MLIKRLKQEIIEDTYSKSNIHKRIKKDLLATPEIEKLMEKTVEDLKEHIKKEHSYESKNIRLNEVAVMKLDLLHVIVELMTIVLRAEEGQTIQAVCGSLAKQFSHDDPFDSIRTAGEFIAIAALNDLFDVVPAKSGDTEYTMIVPLYELSEETKQYIAQTKYLPPMISKPLTVKQNFDYDYYTVKSSKILGNGNHHDEPIALDVINIANSVCMSLDMDVLKEPEQSSKPLDTPEKVKNFSRMIHASRVVYNEILENGNRFYNTHKYDKRGRLYSQGYHVHIQSTEYKKALINLAHKEVIEL